MRVVMLVFFLSWGLDVLALFSLHKNISWMLNSLWSYIERLIRESLNHQPTGHNKWHWLQHYFARRFSFVSCLWNCKKRNDFLDENFGLFLKDLSSPKNSQWLMNSRNLQFYDIKTGVRSLLLFAPLLCFIFLLKSMKIIVYCLVLN